MEGSRISVLRARLLSGWSPVGDLRVQLPLPPPFQHYLKALERPRSPIKRESHRRTAMRSSAWALFLILAASTSHSEEQTEKPKIKRVETVTAPARSDKWGKKLVDTQEMERPLSQFMEYLSSIS